MTDTLDSYNKGEFQKSFIWLRCEKDCVGES